MSKCILPKYFTFTLVFIFLLAQSLVHGQYGLRIKYNNNSFADWEQAITQTYPTSTSLLKNGYETGIDYWFRLKNKRVEFMPEISVGQSKSNYSNLNLESIKNTSINFNFHTQLYALDFEGDCNCPTFSKQGPSINKGLFFHLSPGISYNMTDILYAELPSQGIIYAGKNNLAAKIGLGVGLDLGINDLITITPIISYQLYSSIGMGSTTILNDTLSPNEDVKTNLSQIQFTLRLGFRSDYTRGRYR